MSHRFFAGNHTQRVDGKHRTSVPAAFRKVLGEDSAFYAFPALETDGVIDCRTEEEMAVLNDQIDALDPMSDEQTGLSIAIFGLAHALKPDKEGRFVLPAELMDHAEIGSEAVFVGAGRTFHIYNPGRYAEYRRQARFHAPSYRKALRHTPKPTAHGSSEGT